MSITRAIGDSCRLLALSTALIAACQRYRAPAPGKEAAPLLCVASGDYAVCSDGRSVRFPSSLRQVGVTTDGSICALSVTGELFALLDGESDVRKVSEGSFQSIATDGDRCCGGGESVRCSGPHGDLDPNLQDLIETYSGGLLATWKDDLVIIGNGVGNDTQVRGVGGPDLSALGQIEANPTLRTTFDLLCSYNFRESMCGDFAAFHDLLDVRVDKIVYDAEQICVLFENGALVCINSSASRPVCRRDSVVDVDTADGSVCVALETSSVECWMDGDCADVDAQEEIRGSTRPP